jgi:GTP-binding protein
VTLFASRRLQPGYLRYVERSLRERFDLGPAPMKLRVRLRGS